MTAYRRVRDAFVDVQLRAQSTRQGNYEAKSDGLDQVELALAEPGDTGINSLLDKYWNAWQDVANAPENIGDAAGARAGRRRARRRLPHAQLAADDDPVADASNVTDTIGRGQHDRPQILDLNVPDREQTAVGDAPNDLLDKRDVLVDRLAQLGNVSTTAGANGAIDVIFAGATLVTGLDVVGHARRERPHEPLVRQARRPRQPARHAAARLQEPARRDRERDRLQDERAAPHRLRPQRHRRRRLLPRRRHDRRHDRRRPHDRLVAGADRGRQGARRVRRRDVALAIGDLRGDSSIDVAYRQLVTRSAPTRRRRSARSPTRRVLADALSSRRDSISGVSLDEEMTNLHALPARLPGLVPRAQRDGRDDRLLVNRTGTGGAVSTGRITQSMMTRTVL